MRVLIVGDKDFERRPLVEAVEDLGHAPQQAVDGSAAWDLCHEHHFDVVLSDFLMPGLTGLELCRRVREHKRCGRYTYFIICSSRAELENVVDGFESGVDDYLRKPVHPLELKARLISARRVTLAHNELSRKNQELSTLTEELREQSRSDPLTEVGNRLRFVEDSAGLLTAVRPFFLALCDIDNFKRYNDTYGHIEGDRVLKSVAAAMESSSGGSVYRMGGEEFLAVLSAPDAEEATRKAEAMREAVLALDVVHEKNAPYGKVTISVGLCPLRAGRAEDVEEDLRLADERLYQAKESGRNRVVSHGS